jgi:nitroimidazol reductase NimA-like FMN-containing flavoprotein (pyridoxamine 5'-phosphate oxidase superfamily)
MAMWDQGLELLDTHQCLDLLARATVGRVGVTVGALPAILPVNFALSDGAVVFRTGEGTKLAAATHEAVVAFEVDDWDPLEHTGWSVLAVGKACVVEDPEEVARLSRLPLAPWAGGSREHFVRMPIEFVSGRRIDHTRSGPGGAC